MHGQPLFFLKDIASAMAALMGRTFFVSFPTELSIFAHEQTRITKFRRFSFAELVNPVLA